MARELGTSRSTLGRCLRELVRKGICELEAAPNQHRGSRLRVRPNYWPNEGLLAPERESKVGGIREPGLNIAVYVDRVRRMFCQRSCVLGTFGAADERLATNWRWAGLDLRPVRRASLLGSVP